MKKTIKYILVFLLVALCVFVGVMYLLYPGQTQWTLENVMHFLNQPLPIIGISLFMLLVFISKWFVTSKYGKGAINELRHENEVLRQRNEQLEQDNINFKEDTRKCLEMAKNELEQKTEQLAHICSLSTNVKIKEYGKEVLSYDKETINDNPKEE